MDSHNQKNGGVEPRKGCAAFSFEIPDGNLFYQILAFIALRWLKTTRQYHRGPTWLITQQALKLGWSRLQKRTEGAFWLPQFSKLLFVLLQTFVLVTEGNLRIIMLLSFKAHDGTLAILPGLDHNVFE